MNSSACIEINLDNILHNLEVIKSNIKSNQSVIAVLKDNSYGCGARFIAKILEDAGVNFFAVARIDEAKDLRDFGISSPILVLGETERNSLKWASQNNIRLSINDLSSADILINSKLKISVHINVDTGMGRLGILPSEAQILGNLLRKKTNINVEAIYSHFASADIQNTQTVQKQFELFNIACQQLSDSGLKWDFTHLSNSATIINFPNIKTNMVRPGILLYGGNVNSQQNLDLKQVVKLMAPIIKIKKVPKNSTISYGGLYVTSQETDIATIPLGYANGVPRNLTGKGDVLINGNRYKIAGRVSMDYIMVDLGLNHKVKKGDTAVVLGFDGNDCITADEIATHCNTISYEILCNLSPRTKRIFIYNNKVINTQPEFIY